MYSPETQYIISYRTDYNAACCLRPSSEYQARIADVIFEMFAIKQFPDCFSDTSICEWFIQGRVNV